MTRIPFLLTVLICMFAIPCISQTLQADEIRKLLSEHLVENNENPVVNILAYLENGESGFVYHEGLGAVDRLSGKQVSADQPFKVASITKMFTAVVILQLAEEKKIDLDNTASYYLADNSFVNFDSLHVVDSQSYGRDITIRQLLNHTSGLADMFTDASDQFESYLLAHPETSWTPEVLFTKYYEFGVNRLTKFKPGEAYAYTDVGYFLLGLCIEQITGSSLARQYRERILQPLGMTETFFEYREVPAKISEQAHAYYGAIDVTEGINTSFDWAGGGLVSTTEDLKRFIQGLFANRLFQDPNTLQIMRNEDRYGCGLTVMDLNGDDFYGHFGFWGSAVLYNPTKKITVILSINQVDPPFNLSELLQKLVVLTEKG